MPSTFELYPRELELFDPCRVDSEVAIDVMMDSESQATLGQSSVSVNTEWDPSQDSHRVDDNSSAEETNTSNSACEETASQSTIVSESNVGSRSLINDSMEYVTEVKEDLFDLKLSESISLWEDPQQAHPQPRQDLAYFRIVKRRERLNDDVPKQADGPSNYRSRAPSPVPPHKLLIIGTASQQKYQERKKPGKAGRYIPPVRTEHDENIAKCQWNIAKDDSPYTPCNAEYSLEHVGILIKHVLKEHCAARRSFVCRWSECQVRGTNVRDHMRIHGTMFLCSYCRRGFARNDSLQRHERSLHGVDTSGGFAMQV